MNTNKIERVAIRAVEEYIDKCPKLEPNISSNDKTPIWDGDIFIYKNEESHSVDSFLYRVPLQIKGTTNIEDSFFRIGREYIEGFKADRGCAFFLVKEKNGLLRILYNLLSLNDINNLLQKKTKTINIPLKEIPAEHIIFEQELKTFAIERNKEKIEKRSPKEIALLVNDFNKIKLHIATIKDKTVKYDLESIINSINNLNEEDTAEWRDRFIYYSQKAIELSSQNIKEYDFLNIQINFGVYLLNQNIYHLAEKYLIKSSKNIQGNSRISKKQLNTYSAKVHINLGNLYNTLNNYNKAEKEYKEAFNINRTENSDKIFVVRTLENLATLHKKYVYLSSAETEYDEALEICQELTKNGYDCLTDLAGIHYNKADLYLKSNRYQDAEKESTEALIIYRDLAKKNPSEYSGLLAKCLNERAVCCKQNKKIEEAEENYTEAIEILQYLAKENPNVYQEELTNTRLNFAFLHANTEQETEYEYNEALKIYRDLANKYPDVYNCTLINILCNLVFYLIEHNQNDCAVKHIKEILEVYRDRSHSIPVSDINRIVDAFCYFATIHFSPKWNNEKRKEFQEVLTNFMMHLKEIDSLPIQE